MFTIMEYVLFFVFHFQFKRDNAALNSPLFYYEQVVCKQSQTTSTDCDVLLCLHFGVSY